MQVQRLTAALLLGLSPACAGPAEDGEEPTHEPSFDDRVSRAFDEAFAFEPTWGTYLGLHEYDERLQDLSRASIEARIAQLQATLASFERIDPAALSFDAEVDLAAVLGWLRAELLELERVQGWRRNPMVYAGLPGEAVDSLMKRDFAPAEIRLRSMIARMNAVPSIYASARANLEAPPRVFTETAIGMAAGTAIFFERSLPTWLESAGIEDAELLHRCEAARQRVLEATHEFAAWLRTELRPLSDGDFRIGEELFLAKLEHEDGIRTTLGELLARGEAQLARDHAAAVATAAAIDPDATAREVMARLQQDHPTAGELIPTIRRSVESARAFLIEHDLATIPRDTRPRVEETPLYARDGGFASMDTPGPFEERATEAFYYVTPAEPYWEPEHVEQHLGLFNRWVMPYIDVHEAYPGHFLQFLWGPQVPTLTRQAIDSAMNAEGWAHYTEQMMADHGFPGDDPRYRLAQLSEALIRDVRYVAGIRLHTEGMTIAEGAALFEELAFLDPANALAEAERGAWAPTYRVYTYGKLLIQELARDFMEARGASLREFHDAFVREGALPIPLVRRLLLERPGS